MSDIINLVRSDETEYLVDIESPYIYKGEKVPRVTHILSSMLNEEYIAQWANSLGYKHKSYKVTLQEAADKGTLIHDSIHRYIVNGDTPSDYAGTIPDEYYESTITGFKSFKLWFNTLDEYTIIDTEKELVCPYFGGTADLLIRYKNKTYLLDFKTGKHLSFKYFLQLAAYRYILQMWYNISIDCVGIIQLDKSFISFKEYILDLSNNINFEYISQCTNTFFSLVEGYKYRLNNEYYFKSIFKEK